MLLLKYFINYPECAFKVKDTSLLFPYGIITPRKIKYIYIIGYDYKECGKVAIIIFYHKKLKKYICCNTTLDNLISICNKNINNNSIKKRIELFISYSNFIKNLNINFRYSADVYIRHNEHAVDFPTCCYKYGCVVNNLYK